MKIIYKKIEESVLEREIERERERGEEERERIKLIKNSHFLKKDFFFYYKIKSLSESSFYYPCFFVLFLFY